MITQCVEPSIATSWKAFYFETNLCWGLVDSEEAWIRIIRKFSAYKHKWRSDND
jgi:hypothetical protein